MTRRPEDTMKSATEKQAALADRYAAIAAARATLATALADADAAHAAALVTLATALAEAEATYATAHRTAHAAYLSIGVVSSRALDFRKLATALAEADKARRAAIAAAQEVAS